MTEEEIKKFAKEYVQNNTDESVNSFLGEQLQKAFIEGADFMYYSNSEELKKQLAEKDKEIEETKKQLAITEHDREHNDCELAEIYKRNAELKLKLEALEGQTPWKDIKDKSEVIGQLTKAKELLERLLITSCNSDVLNLLPNCSEVLRVRVEAEQFISEVENDSRTVS